MPGSHWVMDIINFTMMHWFLCHTFTCWWRQSLWVTTFLSVKVSACGLFSLLLSFLFFSCLIWATSYFWEGAMVFAVFLDSKWHKEQLPRKSRTVMGLSQTVSCFLAISLLLPSNFAYTTHSSILTSPVIKVVPRTVLRIQNVPRILCWGWKYKNKCFIHY